MLKIISPVVFPEMFLVGSIWVGIVHTYVLLRLKCCIHWGDQWPWCMMYTFGVFMSSLYCVCSVGLVRLGYILSCACTLSRGTSLNAS